MIKMPISCRRAALLVPEWGLDKCYLKESRSKHGQGARPWGTLLGPAYADPKLYTFVIRFRYPNIYD